MQLGKRPKYCCLGCFRTEEESDSIKETETKRQEAIETGGNLSVVFCLGKRNKCGRQMREERPLMVSFLTGFYLSMQPASLLLTTQVLWLIDLMADSMFTTKMSC